MTKNIESDSLHTVSDRPHAPLPRSPDRPGRTVVTIETEPDPQQWPALWDLYAETFEPLQELALLSHLYAREDFERLLGDERILKFIAWRHHRPVGMAMVTNVLDAVPQISPKFLEAKYPEHAERGAVFFGIMVFVHDAVKRSSIFARLVAGMGEVTAQAGGVVVFDVCRHNLDQSGLERQFDQIARWFPDSSFSEIDRQSYFAVELPRPLDAESARAVTGAGPDIPVRLVSPITSA